MSMVDGIKKFGHENHMSLFIAIGVNWPDCRSNNRIMMGFLLLDSE